jgi:hypothetical protein
MRRERRDHERAERERRGTDPGSLDRRGVMETKPPFANRASRHAVDDVLDHLNEPEQTVTRLSVR